MESESEVRWPHPSTSPLTAIFTFLAARFKCQILVLRLIPIKEAILVTSQLGAASGQTINPKPI